MKYGVNENKSNIEKEWIFVILPPMLLPTNNSSKINFFRFSGGERNT
jgi:hypothetical protein